jgi:hypothetical protein
MLRSARRPPALVALASSQRVTRCLEGNATGPRPPAPRPEPRPSCKSQLSRTVRQDPHAGPHGRVGPPLQGSQDDGAWIPRALPWAISCRPVGPGPVRWARPRGLVRSIGLGPFRSVWFVPLGSVRPFGLVRSIGLGPFRSVWSVPLGSAHSVRSGPFRWARPVPFGLVHSIGHGPFRSVWSVPLGSARSVRSGSFCWARPGPLSSVPNVQSRPSRRPWSVQTGRGPYRWPYRFVGRGHWCLCAASTHALMSNVAILESLSVK